MAYGDTLLSLLEKQLADIQQQIEKLKEPETCYVVVHTAGDSNWYKVGSVYKVNNAPVYDRDGLFLPLVDRNMIGVSPEHVTKILDPMAIEALEKTDIKYKQ